jgi:hypothetical protein
MVGETLWRKQNTLEYKMLFINNRQNYYLKVTPWNRIMVAQLVKELSGFYETPGSVAVFTTAGHCSLYRTR